MDFVKKNAKPIAIAAGVTAGILGLLIIYKRTSKKSNIKDSKDAIVSQIKVTYDGSYLSVDTTVQICEAISKISSTQISALKSELQRERRLKKDNFAEYVKVCESYLMRTEMVSNALQQEISQRLRISEMLLGQSVLHYQTHQKFIDLAKRVPEIEANDKEPIRHVSLETFKNIARRLAEVLEAEIADLPNLSPLINVKMYQSVILNYRANDVIFDEFGLSDADLSVAMSTHGPGLLQEDQQLHIRLLNASGAVEDAQPNLFDNRILNAQR